MNLKNGINQIVGNTKRNHAGNQQPYVPAGNGDESGEYADMQGVNIHYTPPMPIPPPKQPIEKKPTRIGELSKKQLKEIGNYVYGRNIDEMSEEQIARMIRILRYYGGSFQDLSNFSDEDLLEIAKEFQNLDESDDYVYYKSGSKWKMTKRTGLLEKQGIKYYTKQEREELEKNQNSKLVENSQSDTDKKIQSLMGTQCVVCFGKGYSKEDTQEIYQATQNLINEYPDLKNYVARMGDRNNLEKYLNAVASQQEFSEEQIQEAIKRVKNRYYFVAPSDERLRDEAIKSLQNRVNFTKMNRAYAYWTNDSRTMLFMGKMKKKLESQNEYEFNINWKSSNKKISTYYHEMGHAIDHMIEKMYKDKLNSVQDYSQKRDIELKWNEFITKKREYINSNYNKENSAQTQFEKKYGYPYSYSRDNVEKLEQLERELQAQGIKKYRISQYGATNDREFVAECYSAYFTDMKNELANNTVKLYKDMYNYLKG